MEFENYDWHDQEITNIEINRSDPGKNDVIIFNIKWTDGASKTLVFEDVYWANLKLNFGVVANECIDEAYIVDADDNDIKELYQKWKGMLDGINLKGYIIKTISTGSEMKIIAKAFRFN